MTELSLFEYLSNKDIYRYCIKNIVLIFPEIPKTLPGVFLDSKHSQTINAPLWSLPYELGCYTLLAVLGLLTSAKSNTRLLTVFSIIILIACFTIYVANQITKTEDFAVYLSKDFFRLFGMFFMGVCFYLLGSKIQISHTVFAILSIAFLISLSYRPASIILFYLLCGYAIFYFSYALKGPVLKFNSFGDYSYGIYIYLTILFKKALNNFFQILVCQHTLRLLFL